MAAPVDTRLLPAPQRLATFCANPHPFDPELLCPQLSGHGGLCGPDDDTKWADTEETR